MRRENLEFRYFFNAGLDKVTGICDGEGSDVFEHDELGTPHYIGSLYNIMPSELAEMEDPELENLLAENGIFPNLV